MNKKQIFSYLIFLIIGILIGVVINILFLKAFKIHQMLLRKNIKNIGKVQKQKRKILYYRDPMNPAMTSSVPMKDSMGMPYIPVYAPTEKSKTSKETQMIINGVYINPQQQQLLDIRTIKVEKKQLNKIVRTVGIVAYDPELYIAQEEYLQALKLKNIIKTNNFIDATKTRLLLLGMDAQEIQKLKKTGKPQENLFLGYGNKKIWIYASIYENEIGLIKEGMRVSVTSISYPEKVFYGRVDSIMPVVDPQTRAITIRIEIVNPNNELKPHMYVNVKIMVPMGRKIAIPQTAIMFSGTRDIVFISQGNGYFAGKEIKVGYRVGDYYQVLSGLKEGQTIARDGTFFIDSESRLEGVPILK